MKKVLQRTFIYYTAIFVAIALHEVGHAIASNIFGIGVAHMQIGFPALFSFKLYNYFVQNIHFGILPLGGYTAPAVIGYLENYHPWQYVFVLISGVLTNFLVVLGACLLYSRGRRFSQPMVIFVNVNLAIGIFNLMPVPGFDGGQILAQFLVIADFFPDYEGFYKAFEIYSVLLLFFSYILTGFMFILAKKFLKYEDAPARIH